MRISSHIGGISVDLASSREVYRFEAAISAAQTI
jgi:hypothetical protein